MTHNKQQAKADIIERHSRLSIKCKKGKWSGSLTGYPLFPYPLTGGQLHLYRL